MNNDIGGGVGEQGRMDIVLDKNNHDLLNFVRVVEASYRFLSIKFLAESLTDTFSGNSEVFMTIQPDGRAIQVGSSEAIVFFSGVLEGLRS